MTTSTPNLGLTLYNSTTDQSEYFSNFRAVIAGPASTSNFYKIDTAWGALDTRIDILEAYRGAIPVSATFISANYYESTVSAITSYISGMTIILDVNATSSGTVTLNISSLGVKSLMKVDSTGTPINLTGSDLVIGRRYLFEYDGTRWLWVSANSADQIQIVGTSGNFVKIGSTNNLEDSGSSSSTFAVAAKGVTNGDSHDHVGGDGSAIVEGALSFTDITTNNATTSKHGLLPKLSGSSSQALKGDGTWGSAGISLLDVYPVGAVYTSVVSTSPATLFGGTWSAFGAGRVLVGIDAGQTEFDTVEETGGSKTVTLIEANIPAHAHSILTRSSYTLGATSQTRLVNADTTGGSTGTHTSGSTGSGTAHDNLQPYIVVYFWKRTA